MRGFRKPLCGDVRVDETYIKVKGQCKYLYRVIDKDGSAIDFLLTARRNIKAAQRFFRKAFKEDGLFAPTHIGTDKALTFPKTIQIMKNETILPNHCFHKIKKSLQQGIEKDNFKLKKAIPKNGCFQSFHTARKTFRRYEAILWIKKDLSLKKNRQSMNKLISFKISSDSITHFLANSPILYQNTTQSQICDKTPVKSHSSILK